LAIWFLHRPIADRPEGAVDLVPGPVIDFGRMDGSSDQSRDFDVVLRNNLPQEFSGVKAIPTCGCTEAHLGRADVAPGETTRLRGKILVPPRGPIDVRVDLVAQGRLVSSIQLRGEVVPRDDVTILSCRTRSDGGADCTLIFLSSSAPPAKVQLASGPGDVTEFATSWSEFRPPTPEERGAWTAVVSVPRSHALWGWRRRAVVHVGQASTKFDPMVREADLF
jgi:hypothetical protein